MHRNIIQLFCAAAVLWSVRQESYAGLFFEQRDGVSYRRGPYNLAFYYRHNETYRNGAAIHYAHAIQHDILQLSPLAKAEMEDLETDAKYLDFILNHRARTEPTMEYYGPYTARYAWLVYRAIDWTHMHHEQTYDVMSEKSISWPEKKEWTDKTVRYYLTKNPEVARSCAPLDVTMRRAGTMMKPYFGFFRNKYPKSNNFFYAAHWWHPAIYEAQMLGGNDHEQNEVVRATDEVMYHQVLKDRPLRMLLSREMMPRYSRMSPESANIFDNLHMLHGIVYDILAYEGWSMEEKRAELYRVVKAMAYQPGDEKLARKFTIEHGDMDPRVYEEWMKGFEGDMNRIMMEMHQEMMPLMMPEGKEMSADMKEKMQEQLRKKLTPEMQEGEIEGSLHDAMMQLMPDMKMDREGMKAGNAPQKMIDAMLAGWQAKYGNLPDIEPISMASDPTPPPVRKVNAKGSVAMYEDKGKDQDLPAVPEPDPAAVQVPEGFKVEVVVKGLTYPTSVEFDGEGNMFIAEAGYSYGDPHAIPRLFRVSPDGTISALTEKLHGPVNDLLWHEGRLYISHRGRISVWENEQIKDLVTGLPSGGDHHNNQMTVGRDGKIYFGQGTVSNSGVVGKDNYKMGWLTNHPSLHDVPARRITLREKTYSTPNFLGDTNNTVKTASFQPFASGFQGQQLSGQTKASGTVLRMNADGSGLEVFAWGLRNPFGLAWSPDGKLYASENGMDVRGSRPVANDKEDIYEIKEGAWYGWPDYASGVPVTNPQFRSENGPALEFLMAEHPPVEKPMLTFPKHSAITKLAFARNERFGRGNLFAAFFGHMAPMTGKVEEHGGHRVVRINLQDGKPETFFTKKESHHSRQSGSSNKSSHDGSHGSHDSGKKSQESISPGPRRLIDVQFSPDGRALYVVDFGSMVVEEKPKPIRKTGVIWRILPDGANVQEPPANLNAGKPTSGQKKGA